MFIKMKKVALVIDWASLSYHQLWALDSKKKSATQILIDSKEEELNEWRHAMLYSTLEFIKMVNPLDVYMSAEGNDIWRKKYVTQYYNENAKVHYDKSGYQVLFDNVIVKLVKDDSGEIVCKKTSYKKDGKNLPEKYFLLESAPEHIKNYIWDNQVIPKYKGNRNKDYWPFYIDKNEWRDYKEVFAKEIAPVFRGKVIGINEAEGDDSIYVIINYLSEKYDEIVLVTGDSDMNQLRTNPKLKIYNHKNRVFVEVDNPVRERNIKILAGDTSDNIKGIGIYTNALRLGDTGATNLVDSGVDLYTTASKEGWLNQFTKNQMLVNLEFIPTDIQRKLCEVIDSSTIDLLSLDEIEEYQFNGTMHKMVQGMKNLGYYTLLDRDYVLENENVYKGDKSVTKQPISNKKITRADLMDDLILDMNDNSDLFNDDPLDLGL